MRVRDVFIAILVIFIVCFGIAICSGQTTEADGTRNGVLVAERIIRLPSDQDKWYISVIGEGTRYEEILAWFNEGDLKTLKNQVHFIPVTPKTPIYKERYEKNTKKLPTVRVQDSDGYTIFEKAANDLPASGNALYSAIATAANGAERRPWRDRNEPAPAPKPDNKKPPIFSDPEPQPINDGGPPKIDIPWFQLPEFELNNKPLIVVGLLISLIILHRRKK